jgi:hypothetical protein
MQALSYVIDPTQQLLTIAGDHGSLDEWRVLFARVLLDPRWQPGFVVLRDLRGVTCAAGDPVFAVVRQFWPHLLPARAAILTTRSFDASSLASLIDGLPVQVFTSFDAAIDWLHQERHAMGL